jgi:acetyl esterase/lipase
MIHKTMRLWKDEEYPGLPDGGLGPTMDAYILDGERRRGAVAIFPGGGYAYTSPREAEPVALQFNAAGFHAFVIHYSVAPRRHPQPLLDASRALRVIRENASSWKVRPDMVAACGFSAGGHLAASLGVHWDAPYVDERPDALILCYPVISAGKFAHRGSFENLLGPEPGAEAERQASLEFRVDGRTPPSFLWHTYDDASVPVENSLLFARALREKGVPFELHVFPKGRHGLSLATEETDDGTYGADPRVAAWMGLCVEWLKGL